MLRCEEEKPPPAAPSRGRWGPAIRSIVVLQIGVLAVLSAACGLLGSGRHAAACAAGGAAIAIPNTVTALGLWLRASVFGSVGIVGLLGAEALKIALVILALYATVRGFGPRLEWLGFLLGVGGALVAQWFAVWFTRNA